MSCGTQRVAAPPSLITCHASSKKLHCGPNKSRQLCPHRGLRNAHDPHSTCCTHPLAKRAVLQGLGQHLQPIVLQQGHLQAGRPGSTIHVTCDICSRKLQAVHAALHACRQDVHWQAYHATPDTHCLQSEGGNPFLGVIWQLWVQE